MWITWSAMGAMAWLWVMTMTVIPWLRQVQDAPSRLVVQRAGGLIAQKELWVFGKGPGNGDALLLAAGELGREVVHPVCQAHLGQHRGGIQRMAADLGSQLHILFGGQVLHQVVELEHKADVIAAVARQLAGGELGHVHAVHQNGSFVAGIHAAQ